MNRTLVTGAQGQLGSDLVTALRRIYGVEQVVESGRSPPHPESNSPLYRSNCAPYAV
ncbi:MAG: hypothetical protein KME12_08900 [Trichocoleus desertorum ATA4-8-CV12]|nr:hypothetical protein [Trichocoleus desertorum ATA4-8-CV12]